MITNTYLESYITLFKKAVSVSWSFIAFGILANVLNLVFNIYLGRTLPSNEYSLIAFFVSVLYIASIFFNAIINTVNHILASASLSRSSMYRVVYVGAIISFLWIIFSPVISHLFHIGELLPIILFAPIFTFGIIIASRKGVLRSALHFHILGLLFLVETSLKFLIAIILVQLHLEVLAYLSIPLSVVLAYIVILFIPSSRIPDGELNFSIPFFSYSLLAGLSTIAFLSIDILLVKFYFPPAVAGQYAILALTGKMVYFLGSLLNDFIISLVARAESGKKRARHPIYILFIGVILLTTVGVLFFKLFGSLFLSFLFGEKASMIIPLLPKYIFAIGMFTISTSLVLYNIAKKQYIFSIVTIIFSFAFLFGIVIQHKTLEDVVSIFLFVSTLNLISILYLMLRKSQRSDGRLIESNKTVIIQSIKKELPTVTVGIPAYNEERNIDALISHILEQKIDGFILSRIIVVSDGSTDKTVELAESFKSRGVEIIAGTQNMGKNYRQNEIISMTQSDVLVIFDADIIFKSDDVLINLVHPILKEGADLTSEWCVPISTKRTFLEKILCAGFKLKHYVYIHYQDGNNIYTCIGAVRAFSRRFYTKLRFLENVSGGEDQYSYLSCISQGFRYVHAKKVHTYFKLPATFGDYKKYARRIFQTQLKFGDIFGENFVREERKLPLTLVIKGCMVALVKDPFYTCLYIPLHLCMQYWALRQPTSLSAHYEVSMNTKHY